MIEAWYRFIQVSRKIYFIETNKSLISEEKTNLDSKIPKEDIEAKIKKTYKNRHFLKSSKSRN